MKTVLQGAMFSALGLLAPIKMIMVSIVILIIFDVITGVWAAIKKGEKFSSAALRRTVSKLFVYEIAVIAGFVVEMYMIDKMIPVSKMVGGIIGFVELTSVLENLNVIYGSNLFKVVLQKIGSNNDQKPSSTSPTSSNAPLDKASNVSATSSSTNAAEGPK